MISMKSNHLYKKSERTRWFVTNPPVLKFPFRPNSSRSDGIFCPHPRRRRGASSTFRIRKFQSAEGTGVEPARAFARSLSKRVPYHSVHPSLISLSDISKHFHSIIFYYHC